MKSIRIDDVRYHTNTFIEDDYKLASFVINELYKKYPDLDDYVKKCFDKDEKFKKEYKNKIFINFIIANIHCTTKEDENIDNNRLYKNLKKNIHLYLAYLISNLSSYTGNNLTQYEPKVIVCNYFINYFMEDYLIAASRKLNYTEFDYEKTLFLEIVSLYRAIRSSLLLTFIGDDVHACSLLRGIVELFSKIILSDSNKEDFVKFKQYNFYLQCHKSNNERLPKDMVDDLKDNAVNENYICYGWIKNENGKRINNMNDMVKLAFKEDTEKVLDFVHLSSEFVHEDYNGIGYDWISMRKDVIDFLFNVLFSTIEFLVSDEETVNKKINEINYLFNNI